MFTVAITGQSGSGKTTITKRILTESLSKELPNSALIDGDKIKFQVIGKVFADRPLIKRQWQDYKLLGDDGLGSTMTLAIENKAYRALMEIANPIIENKMLGQIEQAKSQGKDYCLVDYHALRCLPEVLNQSDLLIDVMSPSDKKRYQKLMGRHNVTEEVEEIPDPAKREIYEYLMKKYNLETIEQLYTLRDAAFEMDEMDAKKWRNHGLKKMDVGIFNHYDEARFDQWTEYLKYAITTEGTLHNAGKRPAQNWKMCIEDTWLKLNGTTFGNVKPEKCGEGIAQIGMKNIWMNEDPMAEERFILLDEDYCTMEEVIRAQNPKAEFWHGKMSDEQWEQFQDQYKVVENAFVARTGIEKLHQELIKKASLKQSCFNFETDKEERACSQ